MTKIRFLLLSLLLAPGLALASGGGVVMKSAQVDLEDKAALQRGASLYMSYCSGCHAISYHRYSRIAEDLDLTPEQVEQNLIYNDQKIGETINTGINKDDAQAWFGKAPPDLSVEARAKAEGADWIYNYLISFYVDESRPMGWNNTVFAGASMPHVLWELQGTQHALTEPKKKVKDAEGKTIDEPCKMGEYKGQCITGFEIPKGLEGRYDAAGYDRVAKDITTFLAYVGEPNAAKRQSIGVWVVLFLAFFTFMAYLLKVEYWRDIH
jgi:ubiquinol-cytochrome c reductase cytochrome c1 subunit